MSYEAPSGEERAAGAVVACDACGRTWPRRLAVPRLGRCLNCARDWWREAQAAHRRGESAPPLRQPAPAVELPPDVDAFLASICAMEEPVRRGPRPPEEKHDPNESIDSIVSRMGGEVIELPSAVEESPRFPSSRSSRGR